MGRLFSPGMWMQVMLSTLLTMILIVAWKKILAKVNVPVVSKLANEV